MSAVHTLKLRQEPFDAVANGDKTIESLLFDEKRQKIAVGDEIVFESQDTEHQKVRVRVLGLVRANSFQALFSQRAPELFGKSTVDELLEQIAEFYSDEDQAKYGVVGIEFTRIVYGDTPHLYKQGRTDYLFRASLKSVIFNADGHVLVVKENGRDWWDLPGGGIDHGESVKEALQRELWEEVALESDFEYEAFLVEDPRYNTQANLYQMRMTFLVTPENLKVSVGEESDEIQFIDPLTFKDSAIFTEHKIYEYCQLATARLQGRTDTAGILR